MSMDVLSKIVVIWLTVSSSWQIYLFSSITDYMHFNQRFGFKPLSVGVLSEI